jgi:hypothetical protein
MFELMSVASVNKRNKGDLNFNNKSGSLKHCLHADKGFGFYYSLQAHVKKQSVF